MDLIKQYIIALTNLYGQVPAEVVGGSGARHQLILLVVKNTQTGGIFMARDFNPCKIEGFGLFVFVKKLLWKLTFFKIFKRTIILGLFILDQ